MTRRAPHKVNVFRPAPYEDIQCNVHLGRHRHCLQPHEIPVCQCKPLSQGGTACTVDCHNRYTNHECDPAYCPCGQECGNQQIQRQQGAKTRLQHMGSKGWGLVAAQPVAAGSFVIEYIGEVVSSRQAVQRIERYDGEGQQHTYFMNISANEIIDATKRGNRARFINHSCDPNCETQKWVVNGETCVCIYALRDILPGEELTYHYHLEWHGSKRVRCHCGAAQCSGYLGTNATPVRNTEADARFAEVDDCLETYSGVPLAPEQAGPTACGIFTLSNGVLRQAPAVSAIPSPGKQHSPDSSATVTGGPCSDASDLTSSHHGQLHIQKHNKRMRLSAPDAGKQPAVPTAQHHHIHVSTTGHAQVPAEPFNASAMHQLGSLQPSLHYQHAHEALDHQLPGSSSMHLLAGTAPHGQRHPSHSRHACGYAQQSSQTVGERAAPAYTPYHIPGLTAQQQAVKDLEDQELAGALRQRQNVYQVGYEIDEFGTLRLPQKAHPRMIPMKHVFAQRWQHQQEAANLSMSQLLAAVGEQNPLPVVGTESILDCHAACMAHPVHDVPGVSAPAANAKLPMTFQLSQAKQAMRKAETGSPKVSCTMSNGTEHSQLQDYKFTSWQMDQLATSSVVNDPFLEQYIDRLNENFDSSYWSMLEHLFAFQ